MERVSEFFDLTTSVVLLATVVGIVLCLFFLFAPTTFGKNLPETVVNGPVDIQVSLRWIQPILGQAIVEDTLIKQQYGNHIDGPVTTMKPTTLEGRPTHEKVLETAIASHIENLEADHSTRVQWILGRLIVTFTSQGIRTGMVTADKSADEPNRRIIALAQETGTKLDDAFKAERQARIGTTIVSETLPRARRTDNSLERVGLIF
ncbi:MAG TPA: hypothetical protein VFD86_10585 [Nitrospira sp.]|nr:hypothetical protein [Nitrospira sp.]